MAWKGFKILVSAFHTFLLDTTSCPLVFYDTTGCELRESGTEDRVQLAESKSNQGEADIIMKHLEELFKAGVKPGRK